MRSRWVIFHPTPAVLALPDWHPFPIDPHGAVGGLIEAFDEVLDLRLHLLIPHGLGRLVNVHHHGPLEVGDGAGYCVQTLAGQWRKLSPSAELMVDLKCGARCAIRYTEAGREDCCDWTVTRWAKTCHWRRGALAGLQRRAAAEAALAGITDWRGLPGNGSGNYG
ncbi:MAG: hypothetical protein WCA23_01225 [Stellaceae bacterium]